MGLNNWSVASKVRGQVTFKHFPVIGSFVDVPITFKDLEIVAGGGVVAMLLWQQFPSDQKVQGVIAVAATLIMTIYLCWRPSNNPEKTNFDTMKVTLFKRRKQHFRKFSYKDIGR